MNGMIRCSGNCCCFSAQQWEALESYHSPQATALLVIRWLPNKVLQVRDIPAENPVALKHPVWEIGLCFRMVAGVYYQYAPAGPVLKGFFGFFD